MGILDENRGTVFSRKMRVKELNGVIELLGSTGLKVLKLLGAGNTATQAAKVLGCAKSNITYWKNKLLRIGLLRLQIKDFVKIYRLTIYGSKILTMSEEVAFPVESVVLEDHAVKFLVVEGERVSVDWSKLGSPKNWVKLGVKIGNVRVVKTSKHVIIHPGKLWGWDVDELLVDAGRIVERVKRILEAKFGMILGEAGQPLHKPVTRFYSEEAKQLVKAGTTVVEGVGSIDESPPEKIPHEEYHGKELAKERLLLPLSVRRLEKKVDDITSNISKLATNMERLTEALTKLTQLSVSPPPPKNLEKPTYVT